MKSEFSKNNIKIRPITVEDTDLILQWRNSIEVKKHFIFQEELTRKIHEEWIETKVGKGVVKQFIIELFPSGQAIGSVYLRDIDMRYQKAEFGIFLSETLVMGKGYGTQATELILKYAFDTIGLNKVFLRVFDSNKRAINSYLKSGFVIEGTFKDDVKINETYRDVTYMATFSKKGEI